VEDNQGYWHGRDHSSRSVSAVLSARAHADHIGVCAFPMGLTQRGLKMETAAIIRFDGTSKVQRGNGVVTTLLVGRESVPGSVFTSGLTSFPPERSAPTHSHNCGEQVTLLEGEGEVEVDGHTTSLKKYDTTYIPAGKSHRFNNIGKGPLVILWIYAATHVTRTFTKTGQTVDHLSPQDTVAHDGERDEIPQKDR
jgi:quercetin dioxygenase-like cupin family protein